MKRDYLPYFAIVLDLCARYYHLFYVTNTEVVEWYVFHVSQALRLVLFFAWFRLKREPFEWFENWLVNAYLCWLALDFFEEVIDKNYGAQWWELVLFLIAAATIFIYGKSKSHI